MNSQNSTPVGQRSTPSSLPVNRGTTHIFYKTRMCQKFAEGNCRNGDKCTFAHGPKDLHEPPPNWQELVKDNRGGNWNDDEKIIQRMRICRKYYSGNQCPYGDKCTFLHASPDRFKIQAVNDSGITRESSVIKIETVVDRGQSQTLTRQDSGKTDEDCLRASVKTIFWKTRTCGKWEATGQCMFADKCNFAHGLAELHMAGRAEGDVHPYEGCSVAANMVHDPITTEPLASGAASAVPVVPQRVGSGFLKLANKKLIGIYADWIDDGGMMCTYEKENQ